MNDCGTEVVFSGVMNVRSRMPKLRLMECEKERAKSMTHNLLWS